MLGGAGIYTWGHPMNPHETEILELRSRVARLEQRLDALSRHSEAASGPDSQSPQSLGRLPPRLPTQLLPPAGTEGTVRKTGWGGIWEAMSATVWVASAGALIFLVGVIYALSVSIQRGWVSPPVRVAGGLGTGLALGLVAAWLLLGSGRPLGVALLLAATGAWNAALVYGWQSGGLFSAETGFLGAAAGTFLAGMLGARARSDGALAVALATGLSAPFWFCSGEQPGWALGYLMALTGGQLAVHYATQEGGRWAWSRGVGVVGTCIAASLVLVDYKWTAGVPASVVQVGVLGAELLCLAWLPKHREQPLRPGGATVVIGVALAVMWRDLWPGTHFVPESFSVVLLGLAGGSLALVRPARARVEGRGNDEPLLLLCTGLTLVGVAVAFQWRWVLVCWGVAAVLTGWASRRSTSQPLETGRGVQLAAALSASAASLAWLGLVWNQERTDALFLNPVFAGGVLAAAAWGELLRARALLHKLAFVAMELVGVNALALELSRAVPDLQIGGVPLLLGSVFATLVYALAGAIQWLWGIEGSRGPRRILRWAGYGWLVAAVGKLLLHDLSGADRLFRALAALVVGAVFMGAALWANYYRIRRARAER